MSTNFKISEVEAQESRQGAPIARITFLAQSGPLKGSRIVAYVNPATFGEQYGRKAAEAICEMAGIQVVG